MRESPPIGPGPARQAEIYLGGLEGHMPPIPADFTRLRVAAETILPPEAFDYAQGSAGAGATRHSNRAALDRWRIVPRLLRDVAERSMETTLFGRTLPAPLLLGPVGAQELAHREADLATARAAAATGVPLILSNQASFPMEAIAAEMGGAPRWFQLYCSRAPALTQSLLARAEKCGCEAIVVTVDTPLFGWRTRGLDLSYLPFVWGLGLAQYLSDPVFRSMLAVPPQEDMQAAIRLFLAIHADPTLTWDALPGLRAATRLPILLKGILHPDDAAHALEQGIDGIIVSNHGGRQVDGAIGAADALPPIAERVAGRVPLLFDSGIRGGADMFRALALGADAVLIARPYYFALAVAGEEGVRTLIRNMLAEFDLTMGLAGCRNLAGITREMLSEASACA